VSRRTLIIGCGYIGLPLARELVARGEAVTGWVRSAKSAEELGDEGLARVITGSVAEESCWHGVTEKFDAVVHGASSGGGGAAAYREVYLEGVRQMNRHQPQARRIFVSSTSVYGQTDGAWIDESSLAQPASPTSQILREAEEESLNANAIVVRAAGIYGPGRAMLFEKFRRGDAVIEGDGTRWINQVHQDDLVTALAHLLDAGIPGQIYNAADDTPVMLCDYYAWCSETLHLPLPAHGPVDPNRKRGLTNKRISNRKLRATGWEPRFPDFKKGLAGGLGSSCG
jgi:nucleoside-diphosphate-sugar epimerase